MTIDGPSRFRPDRIFAIAILARAAVIWLMLRLMLAFFLLFLDGHPVFLETRPAIFLSAVVVGLTWWDVRRRGEDLLLANLGCGPAPLLGLAAVPPVIVETAMAVAARP